MATPHPTVKRNSLEELPSSDRQPVEKGLETETEKHEAARMQVKGEAARGRTDVSLARLQEETENTTDQQTPDLINRINFTESAEEQNEELACFETTTSFMLATAVRNNPDLDLNSPECVEQVAASLPNTKPAERAALHKWREMLRQKSAPVTEYMNRQWNDLADTAKKIRAEIKDLQEGDFTEKAKDKLSKAPSAAVAFAKKHPLITFGIAMAGTYGLYRFFTRKKEALAGGAATPTFMQPERPSFMKWVAGVGLAVAGIFGLGRALGMEGVQNFFKEKFGWDINTNRVVQVLSLLSHGKFKEAIEIAWEGVDENSDFHRKMAELIKKETSAEVSGKTLFELRDEKFEDFISGAAQLKDQGSMSASEYGGIFTSLLGFDSKQKNQEQIAIRMFLRTHEATIRRLLPVREETTLGEVFPKIYAHITDDKDTSEKADAALVAATQTSGTSEQKEQRRRDETTAQLPNDGRRQRAIENEKILAEKITPAQVEGIRKTVGDREQTLRNLLAKPLKPDERQETDEKLKLFLQQKEVFEELTEEHAAAYDAYEKSKLEKAPEATLQAKFTELVAVSEELETHIDAMFARQGWTHLAFLAASHGLRFADFIHTRWFKIGDLHADRANYLFDKAAHQFSRSSIRERLALRRARRGPLPSLDDIARSTDDVIRASSEYGEKLYTKVSDDKRLKIHEWREIDEMEARIKNQQMLLDRAWTEKNKELRAALRAKDTARADALLEEVKRIGGERVKLDFGAAKLCGNMFSKWKNIWRVAIRGDAGYHPEIYDQGVQRFRNFLRETLRFSKERHAEGKTLSHILYKKGKLVFFQGIISVGASQYLLADEKTSKGEAMKYAVLNALPVVGTGMDFYAAFGGKEAGTNRELDATDRVMSGLFGVAGLATDALSVFGLGIAGRAGLTALKAGRGMAKAARVAAALEKSKDAVKAARAYRGYELVETAGKWAFRVPLAAMLGQGAYMVYQETMDYQPPEGFEEVLEGVSLDSGPEVTQKTAA